MIVAELKGKIKHYRALLDKKDLYRAVIVVVVAASSYMLGHMSYLESEDTPVTVRQAAAPLVADLEDIAPPGQGTAPTYVASRNSSKYHLPWCPGAQRIAEENRIWFATKAEAEKAGYEPAANCPGI